MASSIQIEDRPDGRHVSVTASRGAVLMLLATDSDFRFAFSRAISDALFDGFFWETAPISAVTIDLPFECMIVPSRAVADLKADRRPFAEFINFGDDKVVRRGNLGGDAELVIPCDGGVADYAHLAAFLRTGSAPQIDNLWRVVGEGAVEWTRRSPDRSLWLSTSGLGVAWLHVRLDSRPKYYSYAPYRSANV